MSRNLAEHPLLGEHIKRAFDIIKDKYGEIHALSAPIAEFIFKGFVEGNGLNIEIGFHGTRKEVLESICNFGMLDPSNVNYKVHNGNVHGKGIYVSPSLQFAQGYDRGCLLVLLYAKGNDECKRTVRNGQDIDADFYIPCRDIVVLRSTSQVLPIFAVSGVSRCNQNGVSHDLEYLYNNISYDPVIMREAIELNSIDENVNVLVIYNMLIREAFKGKLNYDKNSLEEVKKVVANMLTEFDYSDR